MSRILGRVNEVVDICEFIKKYDIPKFKNDNSKTTWDSVEKTIDVVSLYLPEKAINYLKEDKICIKKNPFRKYTFISIPENEREKRLIRFPSLSAKEEYKRELSFFLGTILSYYNNDKEDIFEVSSEYDNVLPYLLDYLYLKESNNTSSFSLKHIDNIKNYTKNFKKYNDEYNNFYEHTRNISKEEFTEKGYEKYLNDCEKKDRELSKFTCDNLNMLSSFDAVLQIIDKNLSSDELKVIISKLMLNEDDNRKYTLNNMDIDTLGYKRLIKEFNKYSR